VSTVPAVGGQPPGRADPATGHSGLATGHVDATGGSGDRLTEVVVFANALREAGLVVGPSQVTTFAHALAALDAADPSDVYWAGRTCLVSRAGDQSTYDAVFAAFFGVRPPARQGEQEGAPPAPPPVPVAAPEAAAQEGPDEQDGETAGVAASALEVLRHKDFATWSAQERAALPELVAAISVATPLRLTPRTRRAPRGDRPDLRAGLRAAATGRLDQGVRPPAWRARRTRPRRLVLLLDVSGSMRHYARPLLQFAHAAAVATSRFDVFCFGTRLTRVSDALARRDPDVALALAAASVLDWDGGTQIGAALGEYVREWGRRGGYRGAVVVICSDGLDRGDPARLGQEMARLHRLAHRVVWVNPLKGDARYEPLAGGMAAALPYVDDFLPGHDLASLEELARVVAQLGDPHPVPRGA
jgi:uncharacterized protein with von Willebrand factor type A (vWA) domain